MAEQRELTVIYYFASHNVLAPLVVSELKAIKDAGFQQDTNVVVYFNPAEHGVPARLYDINRKRKEQFLSTATRHPGRPTDHIGDGNDPFVRNLKEDEVPDARLTSDLKAAMQPNSAVTGKDRLESFIKFAIDKFPAKNFILILDGHGQVVGNDAFLPQGDFESGITLQQLKEILANFTKDGETSLQLLTLHSCSMSSIEVAYELKGQAKYMIATQGLTFVNSLPNRQFFKKILNHVQQVEEKKAHVDIEELAEKLYFLCLHNATDFNSAGYSTDLVLCNLDPAKLISVREALQNLVKLLRHHLVPGKSVVKDLILLAHWETQSFFGESHTDLYDFCDCLRQRCRDAIAAHKDLTDDLGRIGDACSDVIKLLEIVDDDDRSKRFNSVVVHADNSGSKYQYARGQSIYFPWHEPREEDTTRVESTDRLTAPLKSNRSIFDIYKTYDFNQDAKDDSWASFLSDYFDATLRPLRFRKGDSREFSLETFGFKEIASAEALFDSIQDDFLSGVTLDPKRTPEEGAACLCPTIKNHPQFSITPLALQAFRPRAAEVLQTFELNNAEEEEGNGG